jgi:hypothetical protein
VVRFRFSRSSRFNGVSRASRGSRYHNLVEVAAPPHVLEEFLMTEWRVNTV